MSQVVIRRYDHEWVDVTAGRCVECCDCGLVHHEDYRIVRGEDGDHIIRAVVRDNRLTAARRRSMRLQHEGVFAKKRK